MMQLQLQLHNLPQKTDSFRNIGDSQFYNRFLHEILIAHN